MARGPNVGCAAVRRGGCVLGCVGVRGGVVSMADVGGAAVGEEDGTDAVICRVCNERPVTRKHARVCRKCRRQAENTRKKRKLQGCTNTGTGEGAVERATLNLPACRHAVVAGTRVLRVVVVGWARLITVV